MFYFRLALALGVTVRELLGRIDSLELSEWAAYCGIEPFGEQRSDLRAAMLATVTANAMCGTKEKTFKIDDFILFKPKQKEEPSGFTGKVGAQIARRIFPHKKK